MIVGGESGPGARPFHLDDAREIIGVAQYKRVAVFVKQLGANPVGNLDDFPLAGLSDRKGGDMDEWPADLRIREFPTIPPDGTSWPSGGGDET